MIVAIGASWEGDSTPTRLTVIKIVVSEGLRSVLAIDAWLMMILTLVKLWRVPHGVNFVQEGLHLSLVDGKVVEDRLASLRVVIFTASIAIVIALLVILIVQQLFVFLCEVALDSSSIADIQLFLLLFLLHLLGQFHEALLLGLLQCNLFD